MLKADNDIMDLLIAENNEFRSLFERHILLEQDLEALYSLKYFPPEVEIRIKEIKMSKLHLKDKIYAHVNDYKASNVQIINKER